MDDAEIKCLYQPLLAIAAADCRYDQALHLERCGGSRFWRVRGLRVWRMVAITSDVLATAANVIKTAKEVIDHDRAEAADTSAGDDRS